MKEYMFIITEKRTQIITVKANNKADAAYEIDERYHIRKEELFDDSAKKTDFQAVLIGEMGELAEMYERSKAI